MLGMALEWTALDDYLIVGGSPAQARTVRASTFSATLELVKEGLIDLRQDRAFAPLWLRRKEQEPPPAWRRNDRMSRMTETPFRPRGADDASPLSRAKRPSEEERANMRLCEALIFAAVEPLGEEEMAKRLPDGADLAQALAILKAEYFGRGVNLVRVGKRWIFRTAPDLAWALQREQTETRKLSRAAMETLAIIAYHQPTTRAEIEDIRGVAISRARWTCCWRPAGCGCAAAAGRRAAP